jgi:tripartite-type tricarboxylate transporter receptor subunit TctC
MKEYESTVSPAVWAPARTPPEIVARLNGAIAKVIRTPEYRQKLERDGEGEPIGSTPEQTAATIAREIDLYARMVKAGALKQD